MTNEQVKMLVQEWERARAGTKDYIDSMPDDKLDFRPVPEVLSFAGQFLHVADANYLFAAAAFGVENPHPGKSPDKPDLLAKEALLEFVLGSYDFIAKGIRALDPADLDHEAAFFKRSMPRHLLLSKALEHHAHHRGQTAIYFRLNGIKPPSEGLF
jgi:uncharacterized damage-inducible protein DinB